MAGRNMLSLPIPSSANLSGPLASALRQAITSHAGEMHHPDAFASDISSLVQLRASVASMEEHFASLDSAYRYHAQLVFAATKLPADLPLAFPWAQPFVSTSVWASSSSSRPPAALAETASELVSQASEAESFGINFAGMAFVGHTSLEWERANVLFAAAALLSSLAAQEPRNDGNSIKRAVGYFQSASAILSHLIEVIVPSLRLEDTSPPHGFTLRRLRPLATLTLAQAQECFWQKAVSDGMKPGTVAKLAKAVEDLYSQAVEEAKSAELEEGIETFPRTWLNHITVKRHHFAAASQFRKSQDDLSASRYGDEIARLQLAEGNVKSALAAAKKGLPTSSEAIQGDLKGLQGVIEGNLKRAKKDNDLIYLEPVTSAGSLAAIQGARMVQTKLPVEIARPLDCLGAAAGGELPPLGRPLFGALVPYGAHLAISVYEDRKETWWRDTVEARRQELEAVVRSTLESLELPGVLDDLDGSQSSSSTAVPPALASKARQVQAEGGLAHLEAVRKDVQRMATLNASLLNEARGILDAEAREDADVRSRFQQSKHWTRQDSATASQSYRKRLDELSSTLHMAGQSDAVVQSKVDKWQDSWAILQGGEQGLVQSLARIRSEVEDGELVPTSSRAPKVTSSSPIVRDIRRTMEQVEDGLAEFASLSGETRALVRSDDVREKVMRETARLSSGGSGGSDGALEVGPEAFEPLFQAEFKKYRLLEDEVHQLESSLASHLNALRTKRSALQEQLDASRPSSDLSSRLSSHLTTLSTAAGKYTEVLSNVGEGLQFYNGLSPILRDLVDGCRDWARARGIDVETLVARFEGTSLSSSATAPKGRGSVAAAAAAVGAPHDTPSPRRSTRNKGATAAVTNTPTRTTRSNGQAAGVTAEGIGNGTSNDEESELAAVQAQLGGQQGTPAAAAASAPQWGAWSGGSIRFGD